jgi:hypothetical protein
VQVSQGRSPCWKLAVWDGEPCQLRVRLVLAALGVARAAGEGCVVVPCGVGVSERFRLLGTSWYLGGGSGMGLGMDIFS